MIDASWVGLSNSADQLGEGQVPLLPLPQVLDGEVDDVRLIEQRQDGGDHVGLLAARRRGTPRRTAGTGARHSGRGKSTLGSLMIADTYSRPSLGVEQYITREEPVEVQLPADLPDRR